MLACLTFNYASGTNEKKISYLRYFSHQNVYVMKVDKNLPSHFQDTYVLYTHPARPKSDPMRYLLAWQRSLLNLGDPAKLPTASRKLPTAYSAYNLKLPTAHQALPTPDPAYLPTIALLLHLVLPEGSRWQPRSKKTKKGSCGNIFLEIEKGR